MGNGELILVAGALLAVGLVATLVAGRLQVPGLVLFIAIGMVIGSDGTGWIHFDDYHAAQTVGVIALALILFEGGLTAGFAEIRPVLRPALGLALVGTVATAALAGLAAAWLFDFSSLEGLLVGSIIAATDGAAIFALLRGSTLRRRLARTLEGEAGFNDPVAVLLVLGFIEWIKQPAYGLGDMALLFAQQLSIGASIGYLTGLLAVKAFQRLQLASPGLYPVASLATAAVSFGAADSLEGSGFLAVYIAGLSLGSAAIPAKRTVTTFHQGLAWLAQIVMFLALGLLVFPSQLDDVALEGTVLALIVMVIARPASTFLATALERYSAVERLLLGWAGLRGAVPIVLATFPVIEDVPRSLEFFNVVFFAVLLSTLLQGATFEPLACRLGLTTSEPALPHPLTETGTIRRLGAEVVEYPVAPDDAIAGRLVRELGLPRDALLNVIVRSDEAIPPRGSTRIESGDRLHLLVRQEVAEDLPDLLERWRKGPIGEPRRRRVGLRAHASIFMTRPWTEDDGDPSHPREVLGIAVVEHLRTRRDRPGALVALADGRYAITGPLLAVGGPKLLQRHVRERLRLAKSEQERAWWQEVAGALTSSAL
jgi:cell volume regulation protein A